MIPEMILPKVIGLVRSYLQVQMQTCLGPVLSVFFSLCHDSSRVSLTHFSSAFNSFSTAHRSYSFKTQV